jgi:hypothetical protein
MIDFQDNPIKNKFAPLGAGVIGFFILFFLIIILKFLSYISNQSDSFRLELKDFIISFIGFGLLFLIKYFEGLNKKYY